MADDSGSGFLVIRRNMIFFHIGQNNFQNLPVHRHSQRAVCVGNNAVCPAGVETGHRSSFFVCAEGKLGLVPIAKGLVHPHGRLHYTIQQFRREAADTLQISPYFAGFEFQLLLIGHFLDLAAAALSCKGTSGIYPVRRRAQNFHQSCVAVIFPGLCNFYLYLIADHRILDKKSITVHLSYTLSVYAYICNLSNHCLVFLHLILIFSHIYILS